MLQNGFVGFPGPARPAGEEHTRKYREKEVRARQRWALVIFENIRHDCGLSFVSVLIWIFFQTPAWKMAPICLPVRARVLGIRAMRAQTAPCLPSLTFTTWSSETYPPNPCGNLPVCPIPLSRNRNLRRFQARTRSRRRRSRCRRREDPQPLEQRSCLLRWRRPRLLFRENKRGARRVSGHPYLRRKPPRRRHRSSPLTRWPSKSPSRVRVPSLRKTEGAVLLKPRRTGPLPRIPQNQQRPKRLKRPKRNRPPGHLREQVQENAFKSKTCRRRL